jgi:hypothetical protein
MPAQHFKDLLPLAEVDLGNAAGMSFAIGDHGQPGGVQIVVRVGAARRVMREMLVLTASRVAPPTKGPAGLGLPAAVKANALPNQGSRIRAGTTRRLPGQAPVRTHPSAYLAATCDLGRP